LLIGRLRIDAVFRVARADFVFGLEDFKDFSLYLFGQVLWDDDNAVAVGENGIAGSGSGWFSVQSWASVSARGHLVAVGDEQDSQD